MDIALKIDPNEFATTEIRNTIAYALRTETDQARLRRDYYAKACTSFEQTYHFSSDEFVARFEKGELGDEAHWFDWYAAKRGLNLWHRRYQILSKIVL